MRGKREKGRGKGEREKKGEKRKEMKEREGEESSWRVRWTERGPNCTLLVE